MWFAFYWRLHPNCFLLTQTNTHLVKKFHFSQEKHATYMNSFLNLIWWQQKLRSTWYKHKLHGLWLWGMFVKLQNLFPDELKTTKHKIKYTNVTEDLFMKKKWCKIIIFITITESTDNVYYVTRQNLHSAHSPYNKNKN